jgi:hypothetical protein
VSNKEQSKAQIRYTVNAHSTAVIYEESFKTSTVQQEDLSPNNFISYQVTEGE